MAIVFCYMASNQNEEEKSRFQMKKIKCLDEKQLLAKSNHFGIQGFCMPAPRYSTCLQCFLNCGLKKNVSNPHFHVLLFPPPFNFGILWLTASVILVSVYLLKTLQHLLPGLLSLKWPVEENEATDVTKNIKHREMKGTRVLRIVGNEMIGRPSLDQSHR